MAKKPEKSRASQEIPENLFSLEFPDLPAAIEARVFPHGDYVRDAPIDKEKYEKRLKQLQIELVKLQLWVRETGTRIVCLFEGRDAAGKGGTISRFVANLNSRYVRVVALAKPTEVERGQWYFQRYVAHLPTAGEMVLFDRSWYNRPGVERVMGFCKPEDVERFFLDAPLFEEMLVRDGIHFFKFWLTMSREEQLQRFYERKNDPLKIWKLSPVDQAAVGKWHEFTDAIEDLLRRTDTRQAPWTVVDANDQRRARLNCMRVVLSAFDYAGRNDDAIGDVDKDLVWSAKQFLKRQK